jgi:hypothetical protein
MSIPFILKLSCAVFATARLASSVNHSNFLPDIVIPLTSNHNWTLRSDDQIFTNLTARVPGDLLSDLMINELIDDPYIDRNFLTQQNVWVGVERNFSDDNYSVAVDGRDSNKGERLSDNFTQWKRTWIYSTMFDVPENASIEKSWKLVLEGIKMGADILINGEKIGQVIDQFLRYDFEIQNDVMNRGVYCGRNVRRHNLTIVFDPSIGVNGRFAGK